MTKIFHLLKSKVTTTMYVWGVIMILELIYLGIGISNLIQNSSSRGDWAAIMSAICVLAACVFSIRREWKNKV